MEGPVIEHCFSVASSAGLNMLLKPVLPVPVSDIKVEVVDSDSDQHLGSEEECQTADLPSDENLDFKKELQRPAENVKTCAHCVLVFSHKYRLQRHFQSAQCKRCKKRFECKGVQRVHICAKRGHKYKCRSCGKNLYGTKDMENHVTRNCCHFCSKVFTCRTGVKKHWTVSKSCSKYKVAEMDVIKCFNCSVTLSGDANLARHFAENSCPTCEKKFLCATDLKKHEAICVQRKVAVQKSELGVFICPGACGKEFQSSRSLRKHQFFMICGLTDEDKARFQCEFCHKPMTSERGLKEHQQKNRKCSSCKLKLGCGRSLAEHYFTCTGPQKRSQPVADTYQPMLQKHLNLQCKKCSRKFDFLSRLVPHEKSCKWDRTCPHCEHLQLDVTALSDHVQQRHCMKCKWTAPCFTLWSEHKCEKEKEDAAWLKNCPYCEQPTLSEDSFKKHLTPAKCHRCGFAQTCEFLLHHHLEKCVSKEIQRCPICG